MSSNLLPREQRFVSFAAKCVQRRMGSRAIPRLVHVVQAAGQLPRLDTPAQNLDCLQLAFRLGSGHPQQSPYFSANDVYQWHRTYQRESHRARRAVGGWKFTPIVSIASGTPSPPSEYRWDWKSGRPDGALGKEGRPTASRECVAGQPCRGKLTGDKTQGLNPNHTP